MAKRDYYEVLGIDKGADEAAIKKAYRTLAKKNHPDVNPGDKDAEERFKEIDPPRPARWWNNRSSAHGRAWPWS